MALDTVIYLKDARIFHDDHLILSDVNFHVQSGEFVYLIGKTGSGKSSLLKTLYGELPLTEGEGEVVGYDLRKLKRKQIPHLRRKLGIVFQDFQLLSDRSIHDNLKFVLKATGWKGKAKMEERIKDVLSKVNLETKGYKLPHELSGGEQQRVGIARALLNDPEVILADEPTGNLDPDTTEGILNLLVQISRNGRAVIMATHDYLHMKKISSRIISCENSTVIDKSKETA